MAVAVLVVLALRRTHALAIERRVGAGPGGPKLLYFRSDHCRPCTAQAHYLQSLEGRYQHRLIIERIDVEAEAQKAHSYGVFTLPTTLVLDRQGQVKYINYGLTGESILARQVERVL
jgi:thioredoxin-like negative regulator of GroEL